MNGCQYLRPSFTLPASTKTTDQQWDYAFLTKVEFMKKYDCSSAYYDVVDVRLGDIPRWKK